MNATEFSERQLAAHIEEFAKSLNLTLLGTELRFGAYIVDAIARDERGSLVVIELKVKATKDTLAQLLLYPHAIRKLVKNKEKMAVKVRSLLISTHVDSNVVDVARRVSGIEEIAIKICVGDLNSGLSLVDPDEADENQVWDQSTNGRICDLRLLTGSVMASS